MKELVFNIDDIFNNATQSGCLTQYNGSLYHIPPYQREYKWSSEKSGGVTVLINDLWTAFNKSKHSDRKEYYLQYITVKPVKTEKDNHLEVIDGQQRLTTLSIMISVISFILEQENKAKDKLEYAIRDNFFTEHIYDEEGLNRLVEISWDNLSKQDNLNKQDIFYMHAATRKCFQTFSSNLYKKEIEPFYKFLLYNVKLIVNSVESHIDSETVFRNLNSNKVPLTEAELIKGLLITKVGRQPQKDQVKNFQEIIEIRSNIGRRWDEMSSWANRPDIASFYFNNHSDAMSQLLRLTTKFLEDDIIKIENSSSSNELSLFNFFLNREKFLESFETIVEIKNKLDNWFDRTKIYNLLGFVRYHKGSGYNNLNYLAELLKYDSKDKIIEDLSEQRQNLLNEMNPLKLSYAEHGNEIHQILLALNVFIEG